MDNLGGDDGTSIFIAEAATFHTTDTLDGAFGLDTLEFQDAVTILAADWADKSSIEVLQFNAGGSVVALTNAFAASSYNQDVEINNQTFGITLDTSNLTGGRDAVIAGTGTVTLLDGVNNQNVKVKANVAGDIQGGTGNDEIIGNNRNDSLSGGDGNDRITSTNGTNTIDGGDGNDVITAGNGRDAITGGLGNDTIQGRNGHDTIDGGDGDDIINAGLNNDSVDGGDGDDDILGERHNDTLNGGLGNDTLDGHNNNDVIDGGDGDDRIIGGRHTDVMTGGLGDDDFVFSATNHFGINASRDVITDFNNTTQADVIDLSALPGTYTQVSTDNTAGNGAADFTGSGDREVAWEQSGGDTIILLDHNGDGTADAHIELSGLLSMDGGDFVF